MDAAAKVGASGRLCFCNHDMRGSDFSRKDWAFAERASRLKPLPQKLLSRSCSQKAALKKLLSKKVSHTSCSHKEPSTNAVPSRHNKR
jgi:hypothetical protein